MKALPQASPTKIMQQFPCPFCGNRDEREFHFLSEAGKTRPNTIESIADAAWAQYLYFHKNAKGEVHEVWMHLTCREVFVLKRNNVSMTVTSSQALRKGPS